MSRFKAGILGGICAVLVSSPVDAGVNKNPNQPVQCSGDTRPYRITARHIEAKGIGYNQGYTTLEGFFLLYTGCDDWIPFLDVRGHLFNNGKPAANAGLGTRYIAKDRIWGFNSYYDYRNTNRQHYNQIAFGLESLGCIWDFRINGYLPVGKKQSPKYNLHFDRFEGHNAILREKYEYALAGFNAEAAAHVDYWKKFPLYFAGGPYYLRGKGGSAWGGQARASVRVYDYLKIDATVSYDHLFKWIGQGEVGLSFSFGSKKKVLKRQNSNCEASFMLAERSRFPVDRFEIIPVDKKHTESSAIDPTTGLPYQFIFVDNTSSSLGTYESPYPSLASAEAASAPHDIIYIFPGDGTTTGLDQGITLLDNQKLWGSGVNQTLATTLGQVTIPAQSNGIYNGVVITPLITNSSGSVVTVANQNEISGLFLASQGSNDCVTSANRNNLTILNSTLAGINASGAIGIHASNLSGTLTVTGCNVNQATNGIFIGNSSGSLTANISYTNFSSSGGDNAAVQLALTNAAQGDLNMSYCTAATRNTAVEIDLGNTSSIATYLNNNIFSTGSYGLYINSESGNPSIDANIENNTMTTYYQSIWIVQTGSSVVTLNGNDLLATSGATFEIDSNTGSTSTALTIVNNSFLADDSDNIFFKHSDGNLDALVRNNHFKGTDYNNCIHSSITSDANLHRLTIRNNILTAGQNAIEIDQNTGSVDITANHNTISGLYSSYAIYCNIQDTSTSSLLTMNSNTINCIDGIYVLQVSPSVLDVTLNENNVSCTGTGVYLNIQNDSTNTLSLSGNTIAGFAPIQIQHTIGSVDATIHNNTLTSSGNQALYYDVSANPITQGTINATHNTIVTGGFSGSSGSPVFLYLHETGPITTNFTNNILNGDAQAFTLDLDGATHTMDLSNNIVPTGGGISLTATSGTAYWTVNGNEFTALNSSPVSATSNGANICMQLNNNTAYPTSNAYNLTATSGTFTVNPPQGNIGDITQSGTTVGPCP